MSMRTLLAIPAALALMAGLSGTEAFAQTPDPAITGTLKSIESAGRLTQITVADDQGQEYQVKLNSRMDFQIRGPGDAGFITPGQYMEGTGLLTNEQLFVHDVTIRPVLPGKRSTRRGGIAKLPPRPGQSKIAYMVGGEIEAVGPSPDYPEYTAVKLKGVRGPMIMLEKNYKLTIVSEDVGLLKEGDTVELYSKAPPRNGQIQPTGVLIKRAKFESQELLSGESGN